MKIQQRITTLILLMMVVCAQPVVAHNRKNVISGGKIVFVSHEKSALNRYGFGRASVLYPSGIVKSRLLNELGNDYYPQWRPDGEQFIFMFQGRFYGKHYLTWFMTIDADVSNLRSLMQHKSGVFNLRWSPNGKQIVYTGDFNEVVIMDIGSGEKKTIASTVDVSAAATWSPDGQWIAYIAMDEVCNARPIGGDRCLAIVKADGSDQRIMMKRVSTLNTPQWSPDGKSIIFNKHNSDSPAYFIDVINNKQYSLNLEPALRSVPVWSHDGKRVAFAAHYLGKQRVCTSDVYGGNKYCYANDLWSPLATIVQIEWSPNDQEIAFIAGDERYRDTLKLYVVNVENDNNVPILLAENVGYEMDWGP